MSATEDVDVLIVGAGPGGMVLASLLARENLRVLVVEQNRDFDRQYRGEILQPRFHRALADVGLHQHISQYAHEEVDAAHVYFEGTRVGAIDLARLDPEGATTWWMTQPELLRGLDDYAEKFANYELRFGSGIKKLSDGEATLHSQNGETRVRARVIVGSDGRFSTVRRLGGFEMKYDHHDFDVLWFSMPRPADCEHIFSFFLGPQQSYLILPKHPNLLQCGLILKPGGYKKLKAEGLDSVRELLRQSHPIFGEFAEQVQKFSEFFPLAGSRSCVRHWAQDGLLLIGDAAHTCSPAGGIGVAIATETACVAAGVIADCFRRGDFSARALSKVQRLRQAQIRQVHRLQMRVQLFVKAPAVVRRLAPLALGAANALDLMVPVARLMLTQRGRLPLSGLKGTEPDSAARLGTTGQAVLSNKGA